jgi:hypothetical protein
VARRKFGVVLRHRPGEFRSVWEVETPEGRFLEIEFDRLRSLWRVTPGEYVRRKLADALGQATGVDPTTPWVEALVVDIERSRQTHRGD